MIIIKQVSDFTELEGIKYLQTENLKKNLSDQEAIEQGFVTAEYNMSLLEKMHQAGPSVVAKEGEQVVGYALVTLKSVRYDHELLGYLFNSIDSLEYNGQKLIDTPYVVVGQLCVQKKYRGLGLVQQIYQYFKKSLEGDFDYCITDVAQDNPRSLKAHLKAGFNVIETFSYAGSSWDIVLWNWNPIT